MSRYIGYHLRFQICVIVNEVSLIYQFERMLVRAPDF